MSRVDEVFETDAQDSVPNLQKRHRAYGNPTGTPNHVRRSNAVSKKHFEEHAWLKDRVARLERQMEMISNDIINGKIQCDSDGEWINHINDVKSRFPK